MHAIDGAMLANPFLSKTSWDVHRTVRVVCVVCRLQSLHNKTREMGGGGETAHVARTAAQLDRTPILADVGFAVGSGLAAASAVAPFLFVVDSAVTRAAAGTVPLSKALLESASSVVRRPWMAPLWMVAGVYGATYSAANLIDVGAERLEATGAQRGSAKFLGVTAVNMAASITKDLAFAKIYGGAAAAAAPKQAMPVAAALTFVARDCLTIGAAFTAPEILAHSLVSGAGVERAQAESVSQLACPPGMQVFCTPLHLLALSLFNNPTGSAAVIAAGVYKTLPQSTLVRMLRMVPAYGIGGILNATLTARGRAYSLEHWCGEDKEVAARSAAKAPRATSLHPVAMARELIEWWELIDKDGTGRVSEADIDAFVARADADGDGRLSVAELEQVLPPAKRAHAMQLVGVADRDHDGKVSVEELKACLIRQQQQQQQQQQQGNGK